MDEMIFRLINVKLSHPHLDGFMKFISAYGLLLIFLAAIVFATHRWWKKREWIPAIRLCLLFLAVYFVCDRGLKQLIQRQRPECVLSGIRIETKSPGGDLHFSISESPRPPRNSNSFPSSHAAYAFAAATFCWLAHRRGALIYFPLAVLVGYSRIYLGEHFPSDVVFGGLLGAGCAAFIYWLGVPLKAQDIRRKIPLIRSIAAYRSGLSAQELMYLTLAFGLVTVLGVARLYFILGGVYDLAPDEAYYWTWSQHLSYGYLSKGPGIAYLIRLFTSLFDNEPENVRLGALACSLGIVTLTYVFSLEVFRSAKTAFFSVLVISTIPLYAAGSMLMTTDPPLTFFYALCAYGIYKVSATGSKRWWYISGLFLGGGILFKYSMPFIIPAIFIFLALSKDQRHWLGKKEPYLFVLIGCAFFIPALIWNWQQGWPTVSRLAWEAGLAEETVALNLQSFGDFLASQFFLINPFYFILMVWGFYLALRAYRNERKDEYLALFCVSGLMIAGFLVASFFRHMQANWVAFAYTPAVILATGFVGKGYARARERHKHHKLLVLFTVSIVFGALIVASGFCLNGLYWLPWEIDRSKQALEGTHGMEKLVGNLEDPAYRLRGWRKLGVFVSRTFEKRLGDSKDAFIFARKYQMAAELSIYVRPRKRIFCANYGRKRNQFDFWPGYEDKPKGTDALFVSRDDSPPPQIYDEFERVELTQIVPVTMNERLVRTFYIYHCYGFKKKVEIPFE
jgi:4-amino-4-deoxy-L-arabinose transferase-like glycosyltransferase/membrane-associated phospholipid phosphatase